MENLKSVVTENNNGKTSNVDITKLNEAKQELESLTTKKSGLQTELRRLEEERMSLSNEVAKLQDKKHQQDINLSKIDTDIEALQECVWTEYELTYNTAQEYKLPEFDVKQGLLDINNLRKEINKLGNVNVNAIEDFKELQERHTFLSAQHSDLVQAADTLQGIIDELDQGMRRQFAEKFEDIRTEFDKAFKQLFGGGRGTL